MTEETLPDPGKLLHRMDLVSVDTEIIEEAEEREDNNTKFVGVLRPNPDRYDWIDDGDRKRLDTFDDAFYPVSYLPIAGLHVPFPNWTEKLGSDKPDVMGYRGSIMAAFCSYQQCTKKLNVP